MLYVCLLIFGFIGFVLMAGMGGLRVGGARGGRLGKVGAKGIRGARGAKVRAAGAKGASPSPGMARWSWLFEGISPLDVMAMAVGAGAAGIIGRKVFRSEDIAAYLAVAGAIVMNYLVVKPILGLFMKFASQPAAGLESMVAKKGIAATNFDGGGKGLISLTFDGQTSQVLARLGRDEVTSGVAVRKGDHLIVVEVDPASGACTVSREIATPDVDIP